MDFKDGNLEELMPAFWSNKNAIIIYICFRIKDIFFFKYHCKWTSVTRTQTFGFKLLFDTKILPKIASSALKRSLFASKSKEYLFELSKNVAEKLVQPF